MCDTKRNSHFCEGKVENALAFVFSCPGQKEKVNNMPVSGTTGKNLNILIGILKEKNIYNLSKLFFSDCIYSYRITNASKEIHYKKLDNKTEPTCFEILDSSNICRLIEELDNIECIIAFGEKANCAISHLNNHLDNQIKTISIKNHLGTRGLLKIDVDIHGKNIESANGNKAKQKENTVRRLNVIANEIVRQISN